jgi:hypothetical protein
MFDNVEDHKIYQGPDYNTRDEDLHKLIRHVRKNFTKHDFYRYETNTAEGPNSGRQGEIRSLVIATEAMKEKYLIYRDVIVISPCLQSLA